MKYFWGVFTHTNTINAGNIKGAAIKTKITRTSEQNLFIICKATYVNSIHATSLILYHLKISDSLA